MSLYMLCYNIRSRNYLLLYRTNIRVWQKSTSKLLICLGDVLEKHYMVHMFEYYSETASWWGGLFSY